MRPEAKASGWLQSALTTAHVLSMGQQVLSFLVVCGIVRFLCAMCVFDVRASSSPHAIFVPNFVSVCHVPNCWLARGEKSHTQTVNQSLSHLSSLFHVPRPKLSLWNKNKIVCGTYHICVLPTPGAPQNSVIFTSGTPPPSSTSNCSANVTIGSWS